MDDTDLVNQHSNEISEEDKELLQSYHHSFDDEKVDLDLIVALLTYICDNSQEGKHCKENRSTIAISKAAYIVHCRCIAVSCSGRISISAPTSALQYSKEVNLKCVVLSCDRYVIDTSVL